MFLSINPAKLFKSGKFMMTAAATIAVFASAKGTTSQKAEPRENHMYKALKFDAPIRVETHDVWTANSESVIVVNMSKQGIKSVDQLGDYNVVWGDTLSTIAAHFNVSAGELAQRFNIVDVNYIGAGITMNEQRNINALESQVIHDAQWEGEYNAKVAASQASDVADAQADATAATHDVTPATNAPVETQSPASEAPGANDKPVYDAPMSHEVPANPVDGSTFDSVDYASGRSFGILTYHTSFSGISVNDLTNGEYQGLWLDHSGNAVNPYKAYAIYYTKQDMDNLVTRYNGEQTPTKGTELERPDQLAGGASSVINSIG